MNFLTIIKNLLLGNLSQYGGGLIVEKHSRTEEKIWTDFQEGLEDQRIFHKLGIFAINSMEKLPTPPERAILETKEQLLRTAAKKHLWQSSLQTLGIDKAQEHRDKSYKRRLLTSEFNRLNLAFFWLLDKPQINIDWTEVIETRRIGPNITAILADTHNFKMNGRLNAQYSHKPYIYDYYKNNPNFRRIYPAPEEELPPQKFARGMKHDRLSVNGLLELSYEIRNGEDY